jgi:SAM-dependent methyltransferase
MSASTDPEELRERLLDNWDVASAGWRRRASAMRTAGMPVSAWLIDHLELQPSERILELAAGPGDTGFLASELVKPGGTLISSDGSEKMLTIARERAEQQGIDNVEFKQLQLEWIDLPTASVDAIVCRWGVMLLVDPAAALQECRRVLKPGGRLTLAVWDELAHNPWATIPADAMHALGLGSVPDPGVPGPFSLSAPGALTELLQEAGFVEPLVEVVAIRRKSDDFEDFLDEMLDLSHSFAIAWPQLSDEQQVALMSELRAHAAPFTAPDGSLAVPGSTLVALAQA